MQTAFPPGFLGCDSVRCIGKKAQRDILSGRLFKESGAGADGVFQQIRVHRAGIGIFPRLHIENDSPALRGGGIVLVDHQTPFPRCGGPVDVIHRISLLVFPHSRDEEGIRKKIAAHAGFSHVPAYRDEILLEIQRFREHHHLTARRSGRGKGGSPQKIGSYKDCFLDGEHSAFETASFPCSGHALKASYQKKAGDKASVSSDNGLQFRKFQPFGGGDFRFEPGKRKQLAVGDYFLQVNAVSLDGFAPVQRAGVIQTAKGVGSVQNALQPDGGQQEQQQNNQFHGGPQRREASVGAGTRTRIWRRISSASALACAPRAARHRTR